MAPEQHAGAAVTALADQFAFADALWRRSTAPRRSWAAPRRRCSRRSTGRPAAGPRAQVPEPRRARRWCGRSPRQPEARWPSLSDLLAELAHDPATRRRRRGRRRGDRSCRLSRRGPCVQPRADGRRSEPCAAPSAHRGIALGRRGARRGRGPPSAATGRPYADETLRARRRVAARSASATGRAAHRDACEASEVRHEQSPELLDARMACLGRARSEIAALVDALRSKPTPTRSTGPPPPPASIGDVAACAEPERALRRRRRRRAIPRRPRGRDAAPRDRPPRCPASPRQGARRAATPATTPRRRARASGYAPVLAAALDSTAAGSRSPSATTTPRSSSATRPRASPPRPATTRLVASGLTRVAYALGYDKQRFEAAEVAYQSAATAAARAGNPGAAPRARSTATAERSSTSAAIT